MNKLLLTLFIYLLYLLTLRSFANFVNRRFKKGSAERVSNFVIKDLFNVLNVTY